MKLIYDHAPMVGRKFRFRTLLASQPVKFTAWIEGKKLWSNECPDPPCHEEFRIPADAAGKLLHIIANDGQAELMFFINENGLGEPISRGQNAGGPKGGKYGEAGEMPIRKSADNKNMGAAEA